MLILSLVGMLMTMVRGKYLEVVIFRKEEWTKVLFHELMHLYSYDISSNDRRINARLSRVFHVDCDFNVTEAYAEFWARILWTMWSSGGQGIGFLKRLIGKGNGLSAKA